MSEEAYERARQKYRLDPRDLDLDLLREAADAASPGPWHWSGNTRTHQISLCTWIPGWGRTTVMGFWRWGMQSAQPVFRDENLMLTPAADHAQWEVCHAATEASDSRLYRHDVDGLRHPDAHFMEVFDPRTATALLDLIEEQRQRINELESSHADAQAE